MHGVVAMVDVGPAIFAELDLECDLARGAQPPDILSDQQFGRRNGTVSATHSDAFLEVQMDRVIPASAFIDVGPVLDIPRLRVLKLDPVSIHGVGLASVDSDAPGERRGVWTIGGALAGDRVARVAFAGSPPLDNPRPYRSDDRDLLGQDAQDHAGIGGTEHDTWDIHAFKHIDDSPLQDPTYRRVG